MVTYVYHFEDFAYSARELRSSTAASEPRHRVRLFGTDEVAPPSTAKQYYSLYEQYGPLWTALTPEARDKILKGNYARLFDAARIRVRAWERAHSHLAGAQSP